MTTSPAAPAAEKFTQALAQVLRGSIRLVEWGTDNGIPSALGLSHEAWIAERLKAPPRLSKKDRRAVVAKLARSVQEGGLGRPIPEVAAALGVNEKTIDRDLHVLRKETGTTVPAPLPAPPEASPGAGTVVPEGPAARAHVSQNSGESEWYTPAAYIEAARAVMGDIDLDPASNALANGTVGASIYYDAERNGLAHEWFGRVWMNPPYAQPACAHFCQKLVAHFEQDTVTEACVLVNNATETEWFQAMAQRAVAVCFPNGRVRFWHPEREAAPLQGQAVLYLGPHPTEFRHQFGRFGIVLERADA